MREIDRKRDNTPGAQRFGAVPPCRAQVFFAAIGVLFLWGSATARAADLTKGLSDDALTNVVMLEIPSVTPNADELYTAIQAQLAVSKYRVRRMTIDRSAFNSGNAAKSASTIAVQHNVKMVFWIQLAANSCLLSFYFKEGGETIFQRQMQLASANLSGQYEVIANGVSSLIEETIFNVREEKRAPVPSMSKAPPTPPESIETRTVGNLEITALYSGMLFSKRKMSHGAKVGLGIFTGERIILNLAFALNAPFGIETARYRFSVRSRRLSAGVFTNLRVRSSQFRFGISYALQLRTFTMESRMAELQARNSKLHGIHGVEPSIRLAWPLAGKFLLHMGIGALVGVNEHDYVVSRSDGTRYEVVHPYAVKLTFCLGIGFQSQ